MGIRFSGFDWDEANSQKCEKHGVFRDEIETLFIKGRFLMDTDEKHSQGEPRYYAIGRLTGRARYIFVIFTFRQIDGENAAGDRQRNGGGRFGAAGTGAVVAPERGAARRVDQGKLEQPRAGIVGAVDGNLTLVREDTGNLATGNGGQAHR